MEVLGTSILESVHLRGLEGVYCMLIRPRKKIFFKIYNAEVGSGLIKPLLNSSLTPLVLTGFFLANYANWSRIYWRYMKLISACFWKANIFAVIKSYLRIIKKLTQNCEEEDEQSIVESFHDVDGRLSSCVGVVFFSGSYSNSGLMSLTRRRNTSRKVKISTFSGNWLI